MAPTYAFVATLAVVIGVGLLTTMSSDGAGSAALPRSEALRVGEAGGRWLLFRAFASGCTAMTGIEAVSNGVPLFRRPGVRLAQRTLTVIVLMLVALLAGLAVLVRAYGITATVPGAPGYESVVSQVVSASVGRGIFYYVTMTSVLLVLALSASTSFADFPRVCRVLAADRYLPPEFARRGSRLVFANGILLLSFFAALLLIVFGGITDHLIPLFAVGALLAFTLSQAGMVVHWQRSQEPKRRLRQAINAVGALATSIALIIVMVSKFTHGAWIVIIAVPALVLFFLRTQRYNDRLAAATQADGSLDVSGLTPPIVVIPLRRLDRVGEKALRFALTISPDIYVVQVQAEELDTDDLQREWQTRVTEPVRDQLGRQAPRLVLIRSPYRQFFERLLTWLRELTTAHADRQVIVLIPELVQRRWYQFVVSHRALRLKAQLLLQGGPHVSVMSTPWYPDLSPRSIRRRSSSRRSRRVEPEPAS